MAENTFAWPIKATARGYASVPVNSVEEIAQSVDRAAVTPLGEVVALPEFGRPELAFTGDTAQGAAEREAAVREAVAASEPRAAGFLVTGLGGVVTVDVRSLADNTTRGAGQ